MTEQATCDRDRLIKICEERVRAKRSRAAGFGIAENEKRHAALAKARAGGAAQGRAGQGGAGWRGMAWRRVAWRG